MSQRSCLVRGSRTGWSGIGGTSTRAPPPTPKRQAELRIALFEMVPENPVIWTDLFRLWDFWFDPEVRWALFSAYTWFPRRIRAHLARYTAHRRRFGLPVPVFSHEEFQAWLRESEEYNL